MQKRIMTLWACTVIGLLLFCVSVLSSSGVAEGEKLPVTSLEGLAQPGISIAVGLDTPAEETLKQDYPQAKLIPYTDIFLAYLDVANGRVDACVYPRREMEFALQHGLTGVRLLAENYDAYQIAVAVSSVTPVPALKDRLNTFIAQAKSDGTLEDMYDRWVTRGEETMPELPEAENPSFTLRVGTTGTVMPYSYYIGTELAGYDIELAYRFAAWLGAKLELKVYDFGGIVAAAEGGSIDCIMSNLFYTGERDDSISFSDILFEVEITVMVRDEGQAASLETMDVPAGGSAVPEYTELSQLNGKRAGVITGSFHDSVVADEFPDSSVSNYNSYTDLIAALKSDKIDYFLAGTEVAAHLLEADDEIAALRNPVRILDIGAMFAKTEKGNRLKEQMDAFIEKLKLDGTLDEIYSFWSDPANQSTPVDRSGLNGENGTLRFATSGTKVPISFVANGQIAGTDPDIAVRFCREYGYNIEINIVDTAGIIPGLVMGTYDFSLSDMVITDERKESVDFSVPYHGTELMALTRNVPASNTSEAARKESFWDGLVSSFHKTFLRENRWQLFLEGIENTLVITLLSILFGTALGFLVFMLCRNGNPAANTVSRLVIHLVQGTPMVVLLMVLYYVIFGSVAISGLAVAVIGFTLTFGAAVFNMLKMGVNAVDRGQYEAAYALGHSPLHTFFKIILPQALAHILPAYQGEIVGLIKATAVVGYIAVQDLTKMGDIVRSRTYEAFFPLIAVTVIYFLLEDLFSFAVSRIRISVDPKKRSRSRILRGVKTHDQN